MLTELRMAHQDKARVSFIGEAGVLIEAAGPLALSVQRTVWALAQLVSGWPFVTDAVPGMTNLLVLFDPRLQEGAALGSRLLEAWAQAEAQAANGEAGNPEGRVIDIPVVYGGESGPDLIAVAQRAGLTVAEVVRLHTEARCTVYALGSSPGFAYLGGIPEAIFTPRRAVPILRAEGRSVMIGGSQTGVTWAAGPTGWHVIGRAVIDVFDLANDPPALLAPGDVVRFRVERVDA
jgi:KipI family sensor histidine kinase inhibitor